MKSPRETTEEVLALLRREGGGQYLGEAVTKLEHALQCAWHATRAGADEEMVIAALLHDIGHLLDTPGTARDPRVGVVNHDVTGARWLLEKGFSPRVARLVGGHVDAKRYLTFANPEYARRLSDASRETLALQGGPMDRAAAEAFHARPEPDAMLRLRSWDEMAKDPAWNGPGLEEYRGMIERHLAAASRV